jgi:hypothetical protein
MIEGLSACFAGLADPRAAHRCDHRLIDILVIAVCAVIACAESWEDIELYGRSKLAWLKTFLALPNGIPSHDTFRRVFMLLDPDAFEACFARWAQSLMGELEREVVAIDGKTVRRSGSRRHDHGPLHLVSAWAELVKVPVAQRLEYQRRGVIRGWRSASARSTASRTRSLPSPSCSTPCISRAPS